MCWHSAGVIWKHARIAKTSYSPPATIWVKGNKPSDCSSYEENNAEFGQLVSIELVKHAFRIADRE